jgi:photosystem II stability/assembly factor-like uncharacterized protein
MARRKFLQLILASGAILAGCTTNTTAGANMQTQQDPTATPLADKKPTWRILGPGGGGALYIPTIQPGSPDTALVACDMTGAYRTQDGGQHWTEINLKAVVRTFAFDRAHPETVYAGATGLYRSIDSGQHWDLLFPSPEAVTAELFQGDHADHHYTSNDNWPGGQVQAIWVDPDNSRHIYLGIACGSIKMFATRDGGQRWNEEAGVQGKKILKTCQAATAKGLQLFLLADSGLFCYDPLLAEFQKLALPAAAALDLSGGTDPASGRTVLYITTPSRWGKTFEPGVYRSLDLGQTWEPTGTGLDADLPQDGFRNITCVATCAGDARSVYASAQEPADGETASFGIFKSQDMGFTWEWALKIGAANPPNRALGWVERDYATTWGGAPFYLGTSPDHPQICYATDWGTCYRTTDGGGTWQQLYCDVHPGGAVSSRGLDLTNCYWVCFDPLEPNHLAVSFTDVGIFHSLDGGETWRHSLQGVPAEWANGCYQVVFDPQVRGRAWSAWSHCHDLPRPKMFNARFDALPGGVCRSEDGLERWTPSSTGLPANCKPTDLVLDPTSPAGKRTLYLAAMGAGVFKSSDDGRSWHACSEGLGKRPFAWRLVRLPDGRLYLLACRGLRNGSVIDGAVFTSVDSAASWRSVQLPEGVNFPNDLAFDPQEPQRLYLACWPTLTGAQQTGGGLYRSTDGGATWKNIFNPNAHVYGVAVDPASPATVFLTTFEGAVCRSDDRGETWRRLEGYDFKWAKQPILDPHHPGRLYVTTFGSSVWYGQG